MNYQIDYSLPICYHPKSQNNGLSGRGNALIEVRGLKKSYNGLLVLDDVSLTIETGDVFGLVGLSGVGKSTLLRCISGLDSFDEGRISVDGFDVRENAEKSNSFLRKNTGMIFQQFSLLNRMTVYDNIALPMKCWKYDPAAIGRRVAELLQLIGLEGREKAFPRQLSGGQKQRVAIARALTMNPGVLFCDEATSALDPITTRSILELLKAINEKTGVTIVVVTHEMSVVKQICNKIAIMEDGKVCEVGRVDDIFLEEKDGLRAVLGRQPDRRPLPGGANVKLIFRTPEQNRNLLSSLSRDTGIPYTVVWSSFDAYRHEVKGYYVLNVAEEDKAALTGWLERRTVEYQEVGALG